MKKLNNKGFTLVELLAVIIILAIVVGLSIPAITNVLNDSKNNASGVAVDAAEKFFTEQYQFMQIDYASANTYFTSKFGTQTLPTGTGWSTAVSLTSAANGDLLKAAGFETTDVTRVDVQYNSNGNACVKIVTIPDTSKYYTTEFWIKEDAKTDTNKDGIKANAITWKSSTTQYKSKSCS